VDTPHRWIDLVVVVLGLAVSAPLLWWMRDEGEFDAWWLGFILWQAMPFALLLLLHRHGGLSAVGTLVTAIVVAALAAWGYVEIERSDSSTAGLGLLAFPLYFAGLVVVAWFIDIGVRRVVRRSPQNPQPASTGSDPVEGG
jgi:hypothetical protein